MKAMARMRVADVIVETLQAAGVQHCWGVPGDTLNYVTDAIRRSKIKFVHVRHEEAAGFAAGAEAMVTHNLTACAGSCGPGSLHFINGLYESHRNRAPVVLIASQITRDEIGFDFPQEVDFKRVYESASVFCDEIRSAGQAQRKTALACQAALSKRGLAVLVLPVDVSKAEVEVNEFAVHRCYPVIRPSDAELDAIATTLNAGSRIAVYGGSGCEGAHAEVLALAKVLNAPIAHTSRAKDFLEYDNPFNVGMTGVFGTEAGYHALMNCDTLLLLGCDFAWRQFYPSNAKIIQIDIDGAHLGRRHPIDIGAVGDVKATLQALMPRLKEKTDRSFLNECLHHHTKAVAALDKRAKIGRGGAIHPQYLASLIGKHAPKDAIYTADGGSPMVWLLRHIPATGESRTIISLSHGTMANAMPQALGAKKAQPHRQVISLSGDGGLAMMLGDLITAIQEDIPIKVAVFNNSSLGFVELEQKAEGLLDAYTNLKNPDFARVAQSIGFWGMAVDNADELDAAIANWLGQPGPALLDVHVDRMELVTPPKIEVAQVFGTALYSAKALLSGRGSDVLELLTDNFLN
jgi:pyruvate dehydrogenase (quinone)